MNNKNANGIAHAHFFIPSVIHCCVGTSAKHVHTYSNTQKLVILAQLSQYSRINFIQLFS